MLSTDQISVLQNILDNEEELIIALAEENNIKSDASIGVAHFLLADVNNFSKMSTHQNFHYENSIKPLIYKVLCDGMLESMKMVHLHVLVMDLLMKKVY